MTKKKQTQQNKTEKKQSKRPDKITDLIGKVRKAVESGNVLETKHSKERQSERGISRLGVFHVLKTGFHQPRKDTYNEQESTLAYSIRGKTLDEQKLRVIVAIDPNGLLIITVIKLDR